MNIKYCNRVLQRLWKKIPKKYRYSYTLCENEKILFKELSKHLKVPQKWLFKYYEKLTNTKKYTKSQTMHTRIYNPKESKERYLGFSTIPILINCNGHDNKKELVFTYLHEVGHVLGLARNIKEIYSERTANIFAAKMCRKLKLLPN